MAMEFPEALVLARQMNETLPGLLVENVRLSANAESLTRQGFMRLRPADLTRRRVTGATSRGKWVFVELEDDRFLMVALESGGSVVHEPEGGPLPPKFALRLEFAGGSTLTVRMSGWGFLMAGTAEERRAHPYAGRQGGSPLDLSPDGFRAILAAAGNKPVKLVLLDFALGGIGNGYAQEILFRAKLHPKRKAAAISEAEAGALYGAMREILTEAVRLGGSETDLFGRPGAFQKLLSARAYGKPCPVCGTPIDKLAMGATTYYCPTCQK